MTMIGSQGAFPYEATLMLVGYTEPPLDLAVREDMGIDADRRGKQTLVGAGGDSAASLRGALQAILTRLCEVAPSPDAPSPARQLRRIA